jgi:hypothetical protein
MTEAVDRLECFGLLEHDQKYPGSGNKFQSRFRASVEIRVLGDLEPSPLLRHVRARDPLILRDKYKVSIGYQENSFTERERRFIAILQEAHDGSIIDVDDAVPCLSRLAGYLRLRDKNGDPYGLHVDNRPLFRVFSGGWDRGGRLYGPWYQSAPQAVRRHITIDGEPTHELDFPQMHFRMVLKGVGLEDVDTEDLFTLPGFDRADVKQMAYVLLNACTLVSACRAFAKDKPKGAYQLAGKIADAIKENFPRLEPFLHQGAGIFLQRRDARIADAILTRMMKKGILALPIHDSFIAPVRHAELLKEQMTDAWKQEVGTDIAVSVK